MYSQIVFGEVLTAYSPEDNNNLSGFRYEYDVRSISRGVALVYRNVLASEPASGIDNYHEVILRGASTEGAGSALGVNSQESRKRPGDRVVLAIVDDNSNSAVIIGTMPHPAITPLENTTLVSTKPALKSQTKPQLRGRYNGVQYRIDEFGQFRLQHTGVAQIQVNQGAFSGKIDEPVSSQTTADFLSKGDFRLTDSNGQGIVISATQEFLSINNTTTSPSQSFERIEAPEIGAVPPTQTPIGQEIRLDKSNNRLTVLSSGEIIIKTPTGSITVSPDGVIEIESTESVSVKAQNVLLGENANLSAVLGENLKAWLDTHVHPTALGPSGPPTTPLPAEALSEVVKVR